MAGEEVRRRVTTEIKIEAKPVDLAARKYLERARAGAKLYEERVKTPRRDPTKAAVSMRDTLEAKMRDKSTWDKWEERLLSVGFDGWLDATLSKGVARYVPGVEYGFKYWKQFYEQFKPHLEEGMKRVHAMPRVTLEDSIARAAEMIRWNAKFRYKKRFIKS